MDPILERLAELDARLVKAAREIKILSRLTWPDDVRREFLKGWDAGRPALPEVRSPRIDHSGNIAELDAITSACDPSHAVGRYIARTARSYTTAARMLASTGTPAFTELAGELFGLPAHTIKSSGVDNLGAADLFLSATAKLDGSYLVARDEYRLTARHVASVLEREIQAFFGEHRVDLVLDPDLPAKAAAGALRVRIRDAACFSELEIGQLLQHEVFVHTATMLNGREQPRLKSLGLGAPRTTLTQEGLATLAELITSAMDLSRLRRIALRIKAVQRAIEGADFIETFRFFLESGQNEEESYHSAMRIFRGGDVRGRVVFTKDVVYLQGLIFTHTFLLKAIQEDKPEYASYLCAGRLTLGDVLALEPFFQSGFIALPLHPPRWVQSRRSLAASLLYSVFANTIPLGAIRLADFADVAS